MKRSRIWLPALLCVGFVGLVYGTAAGQEPTKTKATSTVHFEVVGVQGNAVTVKTREKGSETVTVDDNFRFTVDGQPVGVHDLKPGMKGTATITETTTVTPVVVTEVREGTVRQIAGNSLIVQTADGFRMYTEADANRRGATIIRNGEPSDFNSLRVGDRLSATIVTTHPPKVMTERQVNAAMTSPAPAAAPSAPAAPAAPAASAGAPAAAHAPAGAAPAAEGAPSGTHHKKLPKTASPYPAIGLAGVSLCGFALMLGILRRRAA